mmetsp:Transcript_41994/g.100962  ORF Transcript_41994/g.100962 Transcript_41994/m.100962 type:complete len:238 (-) Transcript_41994:2062-2775(-)
MRNRPAHRRRMEAVVLQTLRNIFLNNTGCLPDFRNVDNEFMRAMRCSCVQRIVVLQPVLHVVGIQDRPLGCFGQATRPEHGDVHPWNYSNSTLTPRSSRNLAALDILANIDYRVRRQERLEMLNNTNGPQARATPTMRNCKRLVKVQMAHICTNDGRGCESNLSIHVCPVHVDLSSIVMNDLTDLLNALLVDAVGRRVGDHQARQVIGVLLGKLLENFEVNATRIVDPLDLHPSHCC